jgi:pyruvate/2-oxoglutarate dehydrogenase complex dihydrolipoamide dehydrogenase (E3) component
MNCSSVLLAVGRGPDSFLQKKAGIKTGKKNSIAIDDQYTDVELNQNKKEYHSYLPGGD